MTKTSIPFPEVSAIDIADAIVGAHVNDDPLEVKPGSGRFLRAALAPAPEAAPTVVANDAGEPSPAERNAIASAAAATGAAPAPAVAPVEQAEAIPGTRRAPRTIDRALLELALIPEAGWTADQASEFRAAAIAGRRSPADVVRLIGFLRSWNALPRTAAAARFACELLACTHEVDAIEQSVGGVWSYSRRQARRLGVAFDASQESQLIDAALAQPRSGKDVLLMLDAVDNEGGFHGYRSELRLTALDTALRSSLDPQDVLHWALEARSIGIDDDADVTVFVRLLTQQ